MCCDSKKKFGSGSIEIFRNLWNLDHWRKSGVSNSSSQIRILKVPVLFIVRSNGQHDFFINRRTGKEGNYLYFVDLKKKKWFSSFKSKGLRGRKNESWCDKKRRIRNRIDRIPVSQFFRGWDPDYIKPANGCPSDRI